MAQQFSTAVRNAWGDTYESTIGTAPKLQVRTGAAPANCAAADTGTLLFEISCPSDWLTASSGGVKSIANGPWTGTGAAAGTAGHYRIKDTAGTTTHEQGTVTATGGGGDLELTSTTVAVSQPVEITTKTLTFAGA